MMRSAWMAQEILVAFPGEVTSVTLIPIRPPAPGGIYRVRRNKELVWDRKQEGGFPEADALKARLGRDMIRGRSQELDAGLSSSGLLEDCDTCPDPPHDNKDDEQLIEWEMPEKSLFADDRLSPMPHVGITYSIPQQWMMQSAWFAQELLTTFSEELNSVCLIPSSTKDIFMVELNGQLLWDRGEHGRFPQAKELKRLIRNQIVPTKDLGHSDDDDKKEMPIQQDMSDSEAADMRQYFGVM
uniref:Selenoprotein W n=1 Tax=Cyclophora tenuis TaxID=216820 RepID=A0A7S1DBT8_CYCTE|mmetsp:Transcript_5951/g.10413  ORF Transcript_5951/g.10413 Transcript_5951/m.10413 type:complete len:241 (+) Transcript_5951:3-725(+)